MPEGPPALSLSSLVGRVCSKPEQERSLDPASMGALFVGGWGREAEVGEMGVAAGREGGMLSPSLVSCGYCVPRHCGTATAGHMLRCVCVCLVGGGEFNPASSFWMPPVNSCNPA